MTISLAPKPCFSHPGNYVHAQHFYFPVKFERKGCIFHEYSTQNRIILQLEKKKKEKNHVHFKCSFFFLCFVLVLYLKPHWIKDNFLSISLYLNKNMSIVLFCKHMHVCTLAHRHMGSWLHAKHRHRHRYLQFDLQAIQTGHCFPYFHNF
jgi:hypothetical protein